MRGGHISDQNQYYIYLQFNLPYMYGCIDTIKEKELPLSSDSRIKLIHTVFKVLLDTLKIIYYSHIKKPAQL